MKPSVSEQASALAAEIDRIMTDITWKMDPFLRSTPPYERLLYLAMHHLSLSIHYLTMLKHGPTED